MNILQKVSLGISAVFMAPGLMAQADPKLATAFAKSYQFEKKKDYTSAIAAIKPVYDNTSYESNLRMGWLNYLAGYHTDAIAYYESAVKQKPASVEPKLGYSYPAYAIGNLDNVIAQYKKILELDPQNTKVIFNLASIYYYKNDFKNALPYWEKMVALYPFEYDGLLYLAWTKLKLDKKAEAKVLFEKVLLNQPADKSALEGYTFVSEGSASYFTDKIYVAFVKNYQYLDKGDYKNAISVLRQLDDKNSYEINVRLGWLNYTAGYYQEAIAYYKSAIALKPNAIEPKLGIAYPLAALGNNTELMEQYKAILAIDPQNSTANYRMGYLYYTKKDYQNANVYFDKIVKLYPFGYDALLMFAWNNYRLGKNAEAKDLFNKVLLLSPEDKSALEGLALIK